MKPVLFNIPPRYFQRFQRSWRAFLALLVAAIGMLPTAGAFAAGTWAPLATQAPDVNIGAMILLPDGTVLCQKWTSSTWDRLTPNTNGSYVNGTWSIAARMLNDREAYQSQILPDGRLFVAGGALGSGHGKAEIYQITNNTWTATSDPAPVMGQSDDVFSFIDSPSELLPNGAVLEHFGNLIYEVASNKWVQCPGPLARQQESGWVKLPDNSVLSIDYPTPFSTHTSSERFIPALNQWLADAPVSQQEFALFAGDIGAAFLLPNGKVFQIGGTNKTAVYTPSGTTNAGFWVNGPDIPNQLGALDAAAAMMANGKILCILGSDTNPLATTAYFYEYDYVSNVFTQVASPTGGPTYDFVPVTNKHLLDLPDGSVLFCDPHGRQLYVYRPDGLPLANGQPVINTLTTNLDGSYHLTGTLFDGISEGAGYGDDFQCNSDFPIARLTNSAGLIRYGRTYNWSSTSVFTGTNIMTTELALPAGLLPGTYQLSISANGISSAAVPLTITGTPLPPVANLAFSSVTSSQLAFGWSPIKLTETGYVIQRSTNGILFTNVASVGAGVTNYADNSVAPLGQYYYRVQATNAVGLGNAAEIFAAAPPVTIVPGPWQAQDLGAVPGNGASGLSAGTYTVVGSGSIGGAGDQFQSVFEPIAGDLTITARVTAGQNTGSNAVAGVMIRNGPGTGSLDVFMGFGSGITNSIFEARSVIGATATNAVGPGLLNAPFWVRLVRSGATITGYTSPDGSTWTQRGTASVAMERVVYVGLAVSSGTGTLLSTATFDNVTVTGTAAVAVPPLAEWKLDETGGTTALDSRSGYNGFYSNCELGLPGATPGTGTSIDVNGAAYVVIPPLNLNTNVLTITAWVNRDGDQNQFTGLFYFYNAFTTSGLIIGNNNELGYIWNLDPNTTFFDSGLVLPDSRWAFVAMVIRPTQAELYLVTNGVLSAATNFISHAPAAFDNSSYLGSDPQLSYFSGQLDEVSYYPNQTLSAAQISQLASDPSQPDPPAVNLAPTSINTILSGTNLSLSWPPDHTGWRLLTQTNHLGSGLSSNTNDWGTVAGSPTNHIVFIPVDPTKPVGYYRLAYP